MKSNKVLRTPTVRLKCVCSLMRLLSDELSLSDKVALWVSDELDL